LKILNTFGKGKALLGGLGVNYNIISSDQIRKSYNSDQEEVYKETDYKVGISFDVSYMHKFDKISGYVNTNYNILPGGFNYLHFGLGIMYFL